MNRLIQIVNAELALDRLKAEEELERIINDGTMTIETKVPFIKSILTKLVGNNHMASMWATYTVVAATGETETK